MANPTFGSICSAVKFVNIYYQQSKLSVTLSLWAVYMGHSGILSSKVTLSVYFCGLEVCRCSVIGWLRICRCYAKFKHQVFHRHCEASLHPLHGLSRYSIRQLNIEVHKYLHSFLKRILEWMSYVITICWTELHYHIYLPDSRKQLDGLGQRPWPTFLIAPGLHMAYI